MAEVQADKMSSTKNMKTTYANISTSRHAGPVESLTQMAVLQDVFMTIASRNQKESQWARWSFQEIGYASNGLQVNSATVEGTTTPSHSPHSENDNGEDIQKTPSSNMNNCEGTKQGK